MNEMPKPVQVYLVEDSPIIQRLLGSAIEAAGAKLSGCSADAQTAIADLFGLEPEPDLILIDIGLASGTGFDVLRAMQDHGFASSAMKVVLTNYASPEYQDLSLRLGADRFFDKSSEASQALELIDAMVADKRSSVSSRRPSPHPAGH